MIYVVGWIEGVADHNIFRGADIIEAGLSFNMNQQYYWAAGMTVAQAGQGNGNGAWADFPYYGTEHFFFVEDNFINNVTSTIQGANFDSKQAGRFVSRYNNWHNTKISSHGTTGGSRRSVRAFEQYMDSLVWDIGWSGGEMRSGTLIAHDNDL